jgi:glycerol-1-phosphate dehydrogenase [NAD(P)+]
MKSLGGMRVKVGIEYSQDHRLILPKILCDCNMPHYDPEIDIYIGSGIIDRCSAYIRQRDYGTHALLIADPNTYAVAGRQVEQLLKDDGFQVKLCRLERQVSLEPDQTALGEILLHLDRSIEFLVAVGSGVVTDLTRFVAHQTGRPFVSVATAASMDGYVSVVAPLIHNGLKVNKSAGYPRTLLCDLEIIRQAPYAMTLAGFGDVIGKYIAVADWVLSRIINQEDYCPVCVDLVLQAVAKSIASDEAIRSQTSAGIQSLLEALILAGLTILVIGNTRPVASIEHNMAHYWEMMKLQRRETPPSHGAAVGVATGYALQCYEKFWQTDFNSLNVAQILRNRPSRSDVEREVVAKYGPDLGPAIIRNNPDLYLEGAEQERRIETFLRNQAAIRQQLAFLPSWEQLRSVYRSIGAPVDAAEIGIDRELLQNALLYAKDYRKRYSVFNLASELGILPELAAQVMAGR